MAMENVLLELTLEEKEHLKTYFDEQKKTVEDVIRDFILEKIEEDRQDLKILEDYEANPDRKTYSLDELDSLLGID
ncbi:MAG: DUF6290 family protein [Defluviitaleaceae bacterium]|nr:DUF6290 family protein [Defluviitaleaceae bacterium]